MITYISGKITGLPHGLVIEKFAASEALLKAKGYEPINPIVLNHETDRPWAEYMVNDIKHLLECEAIYMQRDWGNSKGARIEYHIARELGLKVMFEVEFN